MRPLAGNMYTCSRCGQTHIPSARVHTRFRHFDADGELIGIIRGTQVLSGRIEAAMRVDAELPIWYPAVGYRLTVLGLARNGGWKVVSVDGSPVNGTRGTSPAAAIGAWLLAVNGGVNAVEACRHIPTVD
jgi:hypothetical protein